MYTNNCYRVVHTILSIAFCPIPCCLYAILSVLLCLLPFCLVTWLLRPGILGAVEIGDYDNEGHKASLGHSSKNSKCTLLLTYSSGKALQEVKIGQDTASAANSK